jgi:hypothetical protein
LIVTLNSLGSGTSSGTITGNGVLQSIEQIVGGAGANTYNLGSSANRLIWGRLGIDTVSYATATGPISVHIGDGDLGNDRTVGVETVIGSSNNDNFYMTEIADRVVSGGGGVDTAWYDLGDPANSVIGCVVTLDVNGNGTIVHNSNAGLGLDTWTSVEQIFTGGRGDEFNLTGTVGPYLSA